LSEIAGSAFHSNANLRNFSRHVCTEFLDTLRTFADGNGRIVCEVVDDSRPRWCHTKRLPSLLRYLAARHA
jgi:hypothetical protein